VKRHEHTFIETRDAIARQLLSNLPSAIAHRSAEWHANWPSPLRTHQIVAHFSTILEQKTLQPDADSKFHVLSGRRSVASCSKIPWPGLTTARLYHERCNNPFTATAPAILATVGDFKQFDSGAQFGAWLGLVPPRQHLSGGKNNLGGAKKRGDTYLRSLLIQGAK
jgi:hypothetical protein